MVVIVVVVKLASGPWEIGDGMELRGMMVLGGLDGEESDEKSGGEDGFDRNRGTDTVFSEWHYGGNGGIPPIPTKILFLESQHLRNMDIRKMQSIFGLIYTWKTWIPPLSIGKPLEDVDASPPCMADVFRCMGKAARAALCAIARHLRLRSDVFNHLLDDSPLPANEASSSVLVAMYSHLSSQHGKGAIGGGKIAVSGEVEKGLLTLISSDAPGLQVCDPNGRWYLADSSLVPGDLLLLTGKALSHATAGLRPAASYRAAPDNSPGAASGGRTLLAFRLMPQGNAILDCSPIAAAGHIIPQSYVPISVSQFMDDLSAEEDILHNNTDNAYMDQQVSGDNLNREPSLRRILSDPLSGAFLEDAMLVSCGHSFGGVMLRRVIDISKCTLCNAEIEVGSLIPNYALRAAAAAVKQEDDRRLFHNAALRKRRKEASDHRENGDVPPENGSHKGVQYPFSVNEKVLIKGNRRTPDKFVGKEAVITSVCLNGWYLLKIIESGENVRLQYRSLRKFPTSHDSEDRCTSQTVQNS
ncbi:RING/U-box superfamily protein [Forsythia ovata]|uniref:RING/U-box superfamily protein n=1 Tax=Forsythia ovata TaxID=205694 RepID=A0ABD1X724_9LAMI